MFDQLDRAILGPFCFHSLRRNMILEIDDRDRAIQGFHERTDFLSSAK